MAINERESDIKEEANDCCDCNCRYIGLESFQTQVFVMLAYPKMLRLNLRKKKKIYLLANKLSPFILSASQRTWSSVSAGTQVLPLEP